MAEMAEVIAFLIEHYQDFDDCPPPDDLGQILEDVGFDDVQILTDYFQLWKELIDAGAAPNPDEYEQIATQIGRAHV